jgi:hypothetical protein
MVVVCVCMPYLGCDARPAWPGNVFVLVRLGLLLPWFQRSVGWSPLGGLRRRDEVGPTQSGSTIDNSLFRCPRGYRLTRIVACHCALPSVMLDDV